MIYVSASMIDDYINCQNKVFYRIEKRGDDDLQTPEQALGTAIHSVIETEWTDYKRAIAYANKLTKEYGFNTQQEDKLKYCVSTYFDRFRVLVKDNDIIEKKFSIPLSKEVMLVGKMDRIVTDNNMIIDWKSNERVPYNIDTYPQFIIYYFAYKKLFKHPPSKIVFASLTEGKLVNFKPNQELVDVMMNEVIPNLVTTIKKQSFAKDGIFRSKCKSCQYLRVCREGE